MSRKHAIPSIFANLLYLFFVLLTLFSINSDISDVLNSPPPTEGIDTRPLSVGLMKIVAIFVLIYGGVVVLNLLLKAMQAIFDAWGFAIPCFLVELVILLVNGALLVGAVTEPNPLGIAAGAVLVIFSIVSFVANVKTVRDR